MIKTQIDGMVLTASVLAAALGFLLLSGAFFWMGSIAGLTLVIVLLALDREGARSVFQSLAFGAVVALALALALATPLAWLRVHNAQNAPLAGPIAADWLPYIWLALTILFWIVDRARMGARVHQVAVPQPFPSFRSTAIPTTAATVLASEPQPRSAEPAAAPVEPPVPKPVSGSELAEPSPTPPPRAIPIPAGKEATIYVSLVGEGLNVLRAVRAEHLGRDFYKIAEEMPEGETWQFGPGQVVRCRKKNLSSGKAMVAVEEAPRAQ